jgi:hypothetical protein
MMNPAMQEILDNSWEHVAAGSRITKVQASLLHEWARWADRRKGHLLHRSRTGLLVPQERDELVILTAKLNLWDSYDKGKILP